MLPSVSPREQEDLQCVSMRKSQSPLETDLQCFLYLLANTEWLWLPFVNSDGLNHSAAFLSFLSLPPHHPLSVCLSVSLSGPYSVNFLTRGDKCDLDTLSPTCGTQ